MPRVEFVRGRQLVVRVNQVSGALIATLVLVCAVATSASAAPSTVITVAAHSGRFYGATSTASGGGGAFEDIPLSTSPGQLVCGSAWLRTQYPATGASGSFVLWLIGGGSDSGATRYAGLGTLTNWTHVQTCVEATAARSVLRIQFYPTPGSPTVDMDDVDVHESLAINGGFETGGSSWAPYPGTGSNFAVYSPPGGSGIAAHSGSSFAATNTGTGGGGIYQDEPLSVGTGEFVCGSAWLRTEAPASGASGVFALWLMGGSANSDGGSVVYSGLGNGSGGWRQYRTCVEATTARSTLRVQFYPTPGSPTTEIDDVDVEASLAVNGGFEAGGGPWAPYPGTASNFAVYSAPGGSAVAAHGGTSFGATNTRTGGGGIYEDMPLSVGAGQLVCGSAWLRTEAPATGASGVFALWLMGGSANSDGGSVGYAGLGNGTGGWTEYRTCVEATTARSTLRVQLYPTPGSPTTEIDDVDVGVSLAANGGFEYGTGPWSAYPNTISSYGTFPTSQVTIPNPPAPPPTPVVTKPVVTQLPRSRHRHALRVRMALSWTWRYDIPWLDKVVLGRFPGRAELSVGCLGRGCPRHFRLHATGARRVRALVRRLAGRRFRSGDILRITLSAPGYLAERAEVIIRFGRLPLARLLSP